jgi:cytochrome c-type biogenesis protein CcmH
VSRVAVALAFVCMGPGAWAADDSGEIPPPNHPALAAPAFVIGPPKGQPLQGQALEARTEDVAALLRCPVCQGLSVKDSPATMAQDMKVQVREMLAAGYTDEQILAYFERSYGEFVRLQPPLRGVNWLVWAGPFVGLLAGGALVAFVLRRTRPGQPGAEPASLGSSELPARDTLPDDPRLAAAVRRVRELAYGWPDGNPAPAGTTAA